MSSTHSTERASSSTEPADASLGSHAAGPEQIDLSKIRPARGWVVAVFVVVIVMALAALFVIGFVPAKQRRETTRERTAELVAEQPIVDVIKAKKQRSSQTLSLPADLRAFAQTALFPRTTGYLSKVLVDVGDVVKAGQLLAQIDTPEIASQINAALANVSQARANVNKASEDLKFSEATLARYEDMATTGSVTPQQVDEKRVAVNLGRASVEAGLAAILAAEAEVQRLRILQGFQSITAPFDGTITTRSFDAGALLTASDDAAGRELFTVTQTDPLRVRINVPQPYVNMIRIGQEARLTVRNFRDRVFTGKVTRTSAALDPATRTLRFELEVANSDGALLPGMYGQATLEVRQPEPSLLIPSSALVADASGLHVLVVRDGKIATSAVVVGRDLGTQLEIERGVSTDDQVVTNPTANLLDGMPVRIATPRP